MYGNGETALTLSSKYYKAALNYSRAGDYANAMAYFGASCHLIQDLTIPHHAKGQLLDGHKQFESYVKSNYRKIERFKSSEYPIIYNTIEEFANSNAKSALDIDYMYRDVENMGTKFYLVAYKALSQAQRSTAGAMLMFLTDMNNQKN